MSAPVTMHPARGDNPIHLAARRGKLEIIKKMVQAGANVDQQNQVNGDTPLHTAMQVGAQESMEALLIVGAKTNVLNRDGKKAEGVARDNVIKDSLQVYATLYVMAKGMKLTKRMVSRPYRVDRVGVVIDHIDLPGRFPTGFYCRRERAESATVTLQDHTEESIFSDVFHIRIYDVNRDCHAKFYLPIYKLPSDKEEMLIRFINCSFKPKRVDAMQIEEASNDSNDTTNYCPLEVDLIPETTCICAVYVRAKRETCCIGEDKTLIQSEMDEHFSLDIPKGAFEEETSLSLKVYETNTEDDMVHVSENQVAKEEPLAENEESIGLEDMKLEHSPETDSIEENTEPIIYQRDTYNDEENEHNESVQTLIGEEHVSEQKIADTKPKDILVSVNANILTDVYQINIDGNQPKKGITLQIPMDRELEGDDELVIATLNERSLSNEEDALEIIDVPPQTISGSLIVEISHFSIFVATWKRKVEAETDKLELHKQICDTLKKKKPASFFAVVKKDIEDDQGLKHVMIVECNVASKSQKRLDSWVEKGFAAQNPMETGSFMMCPSDTFYVTVENSDGRERKIQFFPCRNSFQPYTLTLNQGIYDPDEAYCHVIISQKKGIETEEVTRLRVKMTPPPKPPSPRPPSPIISPIPPPTPSPPPSPPPTPTLVLPMPTPRSATRRRRPKTASSVSSSRSTDSQRRPKSRMEVKKRIRGVLDRQTDPVIDNSYIYM
ncbi:ANR31-like protein [Mya arenaria]|uniref:ANR31-like protein n=1 Tax=Mya arenaria TaxID=6604 RepID=A0ABY7DNV5_MYAAR|nr:ANR31-like protein [Mya arenaria]